MASVTRAGIVDGRFRGPRWSDDYLLHYRWCLQQSGNRPETETGERSRLLATCGVVPATPIQLPGPEGQHP